MPFLLLTFLAVALVVTIIGLFLSSKTRASGEPEARYAERSKYRFTGPVRARAGAVYRSTEPVPSRALARSTSTTIPMLFDRGRQSDGSTSLTVIVIGLVSVFILGLYMLLHLLPSHALIGFVPFYGDTSSASSSGSNQTTSQPAYAASQALLRLGQLDPGQYATAAEYNTWAYSACSAASMTEVINAYGHHYRITDILKVEARLGEITPALGLLEDIGIQRTVAQFGFKTTWGHNLTLSQVIAIANGGRPVIVSFPPYKYEGGHLVVVTGGNAEFVYLADSSLYDRHVLTHAQFLQWWGGFSAIVTPQ
jgi:peptidase C39-like protein